MNKRCEHKKTLPLYVRDVEKNKWVSTKALIGEMIYLCMDCNRIIKRINVEVSKDKGGELK